MGNSTEDYLDNLLKNAIAMDEGDYEIEPEPDDLVQDFVDEPLHDFSASVPGIDDDVQSETVENKVVISDFEDNEVSEDKLSEGNSLDENVIVKNESDDILNGIFSDESIANDDMSEIQYTGDALDMANVQEMDSMFADIDKLLAEGDSDSIDLTNMSETLGSVEDVKSEDNSEEDSSLADEEIDSLLESLGELDNMFSNIGSDADISSIPDSVDSPAEINEESEKTTIDDMDLNALLAGLGEEDAELSEIGNLLEKDANSEIVDADGSMEKLFNEDIESENFEIDSLIEDEPQHETRKEKKLRKKQEKAEAKLAKKMARQNGDGEETEELKEKKDGFFSKLFAAFGDDEEENLNVFETTAVDLAAEGAAENEAILDELSELEEEPKKGKKKKKKDKKGKKSKDNGENPEEGEENPKEKKKKEKKEKKEKKKKEPAPPLKKLPVKKIIVISIFIFSIGAVIIAFSYLYPYSKDISAAKKHYVTGNYNETYKYLHGHKLTDEDQELYDKTLVLLKLQRQIDSYRNYMKMDMKVEALNALLQGVDAMDTYSDKANEMGIMDEYSRLASTLVLELQNTFGIDVNTAREWIANEGTVGYTRNIYDYLGESPSVYNIEENAGNDTIYTPDIQIIVESENEDNEEEEQL